MDYPWKLILTPYRQRVELYRVDRDPGETSDLSKAFPAKTAFYIDRLRLWRIGEEQHAALPEESAVNAARIRSLGYVD